MSASNCRIASRLSACRAAAKTPRGGACSAQGRPVGNTVTRCAPSAKAAEIGVFPATPPSISGRPPIVTGGNTAGIAALASSACSASPDDSVTSVPSSTSVATTWQGNGASSSRR